MKSSVRFNSGGSGSFGYVVGAGEYEMRNEILLLRVQVHHPDAAALLLPVFRRVGPLDIAALGEDEHGLLVSDEILGVELLHPVLHDLGAAIVAVFFDDLTDLFVRRPCRILAPVLCAGA